MIKNPKIYFAVPCYNQREQVRKFLLSTLKQTYKNFKVVIVDDGSSDGTSEMIEKEFPNTILMRGDGNLWWSGSTNLAVQKALKDKADYVLTINTDVELGPNYLNNLLDSAKKHKHSLIGSMVCYENNPERVWFFGGYYDQKTGQMLHHEGFIKDFNKDNKAEWLTGMGVLIPAEVFKKNGLFDKKNFPQYFGDADFSARAKRAGYSLWVAYKARVLADVESSWFIKQVKNPKARFLIDLFFSRRSPYQISTRYKFYKKYWPGNYRKALLRAYFVSYLPVYATTIKSYIKKLKHIKR